MTHYVLDASVAAKWFLPAEEEPHTHEALELLSDFVAGVVNLLVPDLFWAECGNILWKATRQQRISRGVAEASIARLQEIDLTTVSSRSLLKGSFAIATQHDRTVYDAVYVALVVGHKVPLITDDERLANALASRFPVQWLGAYSATR